ncbi:MAG: integrase arm-type DNA-binding domain-containing protein [Pseudomonadota bacterium]
MPRQTERLSTKGIEAKKTPGYYLDGGGLYLQISKSTTKSWIFRYALNGRPREMGLGPLSTFGLAEARVRAQACRQLLHDGVDPIEARDQAKRERALTADNAKTFDECAAAYIKAHRSKWSNAKHAEQWENTLDAYCGPVFGSLNVAAVDTAHVLRACEPIWTTKPETATRLRGRIEAVLDWARVRGYRSGDNPARWKGHMQALLPTISKSTRVKHHAALPYDHIGEFMVELRKQEGVAAPALEFAILTACRTGEVIGATPAEFDLAKSLWTIPAARMKTGKEHRVPLSPRVVAIVRSQLKTGDDHVFPGQRAHRPMSNMAMLSVLKRMERTDLTVHGFRSTFRDWAAELTSYPNHVVEMALAHIVKGVEGDYRRGDLFEKRQHLMLDWAKYCAQPRRPAKVIPITASRKRRA